MGFWSDFKAAMNPGPRAIRAEAAVLDKSRIPVTHVVGESFYQPGISAACRREQDEAVSFECRATVRLEPENPHDREALVVEIKGHKVGHISHDEAPIWRPVAKRAYREGVRITCPAKINARGPDERRTTVNAGVVLWLLEPKKLDAKITEALTEASA